MSDIFQLLIQRHIRPTTHTHERTYKCIKKTYTHLYICATTKATEAKITNSNDKHPSLTTKEKTLI